MELYLKMLLLILYELRTRKTNYLGANTGIEQHHHMQFSLALLT